MVATSEDVARRAGVSRATVSQILNGRGERFTPDTQARVRQAAEDLGYEPSAAGRALARGSSDFVIALLPHPTFGSNLQDLFDPITAELAAHGFTLVLRLSTTSTEALDRLVSGMKPAALLSITPFSEANRRLLEDRGIRHLDPVGAAGKDPFAAIGAMQVHHLVSRGYQRIAFAHLRDPRDNTFGIHRERTIRASCRTAGLPDPKVTWLGLNIEEALAALDELSAPGVGIACYNDDVATALLTAAKLRGFRVPEDVALIGMDHTPLSQLTLPPLTTIRLNLEASVRSITGRLLTLLGVHPLAETELRSNIALELVPGGST
ncbi:LacI family DNA-binding transcriptional regulator [Streptomyces viridochromogenes]|uniref:LacI family DNA-binding transcriptional regulator n=1 Tax=Streptomyces viridochromogenes TaxID=1938 RepID=UPI00069D7C2A|nr:LacI family DNA-binding transcriptional regulator [Streptomyces viridochromogenes]KOG16916.1 hypothetical protein ADK36_25600 [Streptomyces viridochromogenes]KOG18212.1 hypothetical protein ADK35_22455 [Streptomyces viridochromogenes]